MNKPNNEWVETIIKLYTILNKHADKKDFYWTQLGTDLEDLISQTLQQQREEKIERVKGLIKKELFPIQEYEREGWERTKKYNQAISDVLKIMEEK